MNIDNLVMDTLDINNVDISVSRYGNKIIFDFYDKTITPTRDYVKHDSFLTISISTEKFIEYRNRLYSEHNVDIDMEIPNEIVFFMIKFNNMDAIKFDKLLSFLDVVYLEYTDLDCGPISIVLLSSEDDPQIMFDINQKYIGYKDYLMRDRCYTEEDYISFIEQLRYEYDVIESKEEI